MGKLDGRSDNVSDSWDHILKGATANSKETQETFRGNYNGLFTSMMRVLSESQHQLPWQASQHEDCQQCLFSYNSQ